MEFFFSPPQILCEKVFLFAKKTCTASPCRAVEITGNTVTYNATLATQRQRLESLCPVVCRLFRVPCHSFPHSSPLSFLKICNRKRGWQPDPQHLLTACMYARWKKKKKKFIYRCQRMVKNYTLVAVLASNLSRGAAPALRFFFREPIVPDEYFKTNTRNFYPMFARFTALPMFLLFDLGRGTRRFIDSFHAPRLLSPPPATRYIVFLRPNKSRFTHQSRTLIYRGVARLRLCTVRVFIIRESNCFTGHTISSLRP